MESPRLLRSVIVNKLPPQPGRLDVFLLSPGIEEKGETLTSVSPRMIQGPVGKLLEFVRTLPDGSAMTVVTDRFEVRGGQLLPAVDDEILEDRAIDLWVLATKAELKEILLRLPSISGRHEPHRRSEQSLRDDA